jgi:hypothetical protein
MELEIPRCNAFYYIINKTKNITSVASPPPSFSPHYLVLERAVVIEVEAPQISRIGLVMKKP